MAEIAAWDALRAGQCESAAYCEADNLYRAEGNQALRSKRLLAMAKQEQGSGIADN